jgi:hypothetical protein
MLIVAAGFLLVCSPGVYGQPIPGRPLDAVVAEAERQLRSDDPREVAWGAVTSGQYHLLTLRPLIEAALTRRYDASGRTAWALEQALLDALVQLDARVPAAAVLPYFTRWPVQSLILLANSSEGRDAALLPLVSSTGGQAWNAVANLLLQTRPPGFAFRLFDGLRLKLNVQVIDVPNSTGVIGGGSVGGVTERGGIVLTAPGMPSIPHYLFAVEGPGAAVLAYGPVTVYFVRRVSPPPPTVQSPSELDAFRPTDFQRVRYINALVKRSVSTAPLYETNYAEIKWTNLEGFRAGIAEHRRRVEQTLRSFAALLVRSGDMTDEEARRLTPEVQITVIDRRTQSFGPLPAIQ